MSTSRGDSLPDRTYRWPTLQALRQFDEPAQLAELRERVRALYPLADEQLTLTIPDGQKAEIDSRIQWALFELQEHGAAEDVTRGEWRITDPGRGLTQAEVERWP